MTKATLYVSRSKKGAVVLEIQPENAGKRTLTDSVFREDEKIKSLQPGEYEVEVELEGDLVEHHGAEYLVHRKPSFEPAGNSAP